MVLDALTLGDMEAHLAGEDEEHATRFGWHPARSTDVTVRAAIRRWQEGWRTEVTIAFSTAAVTHRRLLSRGSASGSGRRTFSARCRRP